MTPASRGYHHGNLREAVIEASFALLRDHGLAEFSVAKVARSIGVSTASPYRHFSDRDHLLAAVAAQAAAELADRITADVDTAGSDPRERFAITAGSYVRHVAERGAGLDVIFATSLSRLDDPDLSAAGRRLIDLFIALAEQAAPDATTTEPLALSERHLVSAHGYVSLLRAGFFKNRRPRDTVDTIADRAVAASRALVDLC